MYGKLFHTTRNYMAAAKIRETLPLLSTILRKRTKDNKVFNVCMRQTISINEERIQHLEEQSHDSMYETATPQEKRILDVLSKGIIT
jgi:hypothetical protein